MTTEQTDDDGTALSTMRTFGRATHSRRRLLAGAGAVLGAGLLSSGNVVAQAEEDEEDETTVPPGFDQPNTDVDVLNYALTLEKLEATFYETGLEAFDAAALGEASDLEDMGQFIVDQLGTISEHESTHVDQLTRVVEVLGGEPAEPEFDLEHESAETFLATARTLENTGVAAYAGAAPRIESPDVLSAALSIHSVESRHAAILNWVTGESPYPAAFDQPMAMPAVIEAIQPFLAEEEEETPTETDAPGNATETPAETEVPGNETEVPGNATETPGNETEVPGNLTETPTNGTVTPDNGTGLNETNGS